MPLGRSGPRGTEADTASVNPWEACELPRLMPVTAYQCLSHLPLLICAVQALEETVRRELEGTRALALQVRDVMSVVNDSLTTAPRAIEETRAQLRQVSADIEATQRSISGMSIKPEHHACAPSYALCALCLSAMLQSDSTINVVSVRQPMQVGWQAGASFSSRSNMHV